MSIDAFNLFLGVMSLIALLVFIQVAKRLPEFGAHGLVLSGGFVSKAPMYVMRGAMPIRSMSYYMNCW